MSPVAKTLALAGVEQGFFSLKLYISTSCEKYCGPLFITQWVKLAGSIFVAYFLGQVGLCRYTLNGKHKRSVWLLKSTHCRTDTWYGMRNRQASLMGGVGRWLDAALPGQLQQHVDRSTTCCHTWLPLPLPQRHGPHARPTVVDPIATTVRRFSTYCSH